MTIDEILTMVSIALGSADVSACSTDDAKRDEHILIDEIIAAVNHALTECPAPAVVPYTTINAPKQVRVVGDYR